MDRTVSFPMYTPSENEPYMNERQRSYFKEKLNLTKADLTEKLKQTRQRIKKLKHAGPDILDRGNILINIEQEAGASERYSGYLKHIERALRRIEDGSFGFCEVTGEKIGLRRLEVQPWTSLSIEVLEECEADRRSA